MSTAQAPNSRASLLAGLRTGGVRSTLASLPQTAGPTATSFNVNPRYVSQRHQAVFPEEEEYADPHDYQQNIYANYHGSGLARNVPITAAVDGPGNRFATQQNGSMNFNQMPMTPSANPNGMSQPAYMHQQALQMQMMQLEMMRIQVRCRAHVHCIDAQRFYFIGGAGTTVSSAGRTHCTSPASATSPEQANQHGLQPSCLCWPAQ